MNAIARGLVTAAVFGLATGVAHGGSVLTYTVSGTTSGQFGTTSFTNALVTFTAIADTSNIVSNSIGLLAVRAKSATVNVAGIGTATITSTIAAYDTGNMHVPGNMQAGLEVTADPLTSFANLAGLRLPDFASYDLATPIGPLSGRGSIGTTIPQTTSGQLVISDPETFVTFAAATVPEPSTLVLAVSAALAGAFCRVWGPISRRP